MGAFPNLKILQLPALKDNYIYLIHDPETGVTAAVDPSESEPVKERLHREGWTLTHVFNTHHHADHVGGNSDLQRLGRIHFISGDPKRIAETTVIAREKESLLFGTFEVLVFEIPGHTLTHVAYYFPKAKALFSGDTLFTLGCGRLFEGTPQQMWRSLKKLAELPEETLVYCGHEYTEANARFALTVDPDNAALQQRAANVQALRREKKSTVPAPLGEEMATNPFLRAATADAFARLREAKDVF